MRFLTVLVEHPVAREVRIFPLLISTLRISSREVRIAFLAHLWPKSFISALLDKSDN